MTAVTSRWLEGNFAPVPDELDATDLEVEGAVPPSLEGRYVRTGPNPIGSPGDDYHWFVGHGMVHGVRLAGGRAEWYRNRWVLSPEIAAERGVDPVPTPSGSPFSGLGNTNVFHHAGRVFAITELSLPYELDKELDTVRQVDFGGPMPAGMVAHPKFDPATGEMHTVAYHFEEPWLRYHAVDAGGTLTRTEVIDVAGPVMVHDFAVTVSSIVVFDLPVVFDLEAALADVPLPYRWDPDYTARVGVMPRDGSGADTRWAEVEPCYVFHPLGAFDDDGTVVVDVARHPKMFATTLTGPDEGPPTLDRWTIDPAAGKVVEERLDERGQEFPRADERRAGRQHRYGYTVATSGPDLVGGLLKHDLATGESVAYDLGEGRSAGEFVFVPDRDDAGEDEGWLMGYVYDAGTDRSALWVLDAHDFGAAPQAVVHLPRRVPYGFHGNWLPDSVT